MCAPLRWSDLRLVPEYFVNVVDTALLHVAALTDLTVNNERIFAFAAPYNWNDVLAAARTVRPDLQVPEDLKDNSRDQTTVDTDLSKKLLRNHFSQNDFIGLEQSVKENLASLQ